MSNLIASRSRVSKSLAPATLLLFLAAFFSPTQAATWTQENGYRWTLLTVSKPGKVGFTLLSPTETGVTFTNRLDELEGEANRVLHNGSGVAAGDFDNDGLPDLFFCGLGGTNVLYKNLGGMKFRDVTTGSGIVCSNRYCRGAVFADINGDGKLDLLVATTGEGVLCFQNLGNGAFTNITAFAGTATPNGSVTLALADFDGNGTLDLYVANNRTDDIRDRGQVQLSMQNGKLVVPPQYRNRLAVSNGALLEYGEPDILYSNDGNGHFVPIPWTGGTFLDEYGRKLPGPPADWGLTATFRDINGDGWPDIYVCNDYWTPDRIWINDGHGHFQAIARLALRDTSASSMGVDFADITRTGTFDFFVVDMLSRDLRLRRRQMLAQKAYPLPVGEILNRPQFLRNTLQHNRGDGTFAEVAEFAGLAASEWAWSPQFIDVDLDGYEDILVTTGHIKDVQDLDATETLEARERQVSDKTARSREEFVRTKLENLKVYPHLLTPIVAFKNQGGLKFQDVTDQWGTGQGGVHHAMAMADLDGDGDMDLVVNNLDTVATVFRNDGPGARVKVSLAGLAPNTQGIGATIKLFGGAVPMQMQEVVSGGRYMSGGEPALVFAAGSAKEGLAIEVQWPNGKISKIQNVQADRAYEIQEPAGPAPGRKAPPQVAAADALFEDVSSWLSHTNKDAAFDDFQRQPLLHRKLSQNGPGAAWFDLDGDGWEDLVIGGGGGGEMAVFRNNGNGGLEKTNLFNQPLTRDQQGIICWNPPPGQAAILSAFSNYEDGLPVGAGVRRFDFATQTASDLIPAQPSSFGPMAMADFDGDGDLDLFVGGRVIPGKYPEAATSTIYVNENGSFKAFQELPAFGLVSGAIWSDLDGDGYPELILACEWGPVRVLKRSKEAGKFAEITESLQLSRFVGWWNSVSVGDFDGDGKMDIVAGNWGLNTAYHSEPGHPVALLYGDLAARGAVDLVETVYDPDLKAEAPRRNRDGLSKALPDLAARFPTHRGFSEASVPQLLGKAVETMKRVEANTLATTLFLNRGSHFEAVALPDEAQWAPVFGLSVADFDGDGNEDLFLAQNFFAWQPEMARSDAGRGLVLLGDGRGHFTPTSALKSGVAAYGEQRGSAVADFDHDGRVDLLVTQNGGASKLFHNKGAKIGHRVRLQGTGQNGAAVGAQIRLKFPSGWGPRRQVSVGGGYLSQDAAAQVLGGASELVGIEIIWPGGKVSEMPLSETREIVVAIPGQTPAR